MDWFSKVIFSLYTRGKIIFKSLFNACTHKILGTVWGTRQLKEVWFYIQGLWGSTAMFSKFIRASRRKNQTVHFVPNNDDDNRFRHLEDDHLWQFFFALLCFAFFAPFVSRWMCLTFCFAGCCSTCAIPIQQICFSLGAWPLTCSVPKAYGLTWNIAGQSIVVLLCCFSTLWSLMFFRVIFNIIIKIFEWN